VSQDPSRLAGALAAIDEANSGDPNLITVAGLSRPKEVLHAELVTAWIHRLRPDPSEELLLAARAHHIRRWLSPRSSYPEGRAAYLRWRRDLSVREAADVGEILAHAGYPSTTIERVSAIVRKQHLAEDPDVQALEDAMCLVFLETQLDDLAGRLTRDRMVDVLRKTMVKMSPTASGWLGPSRCPTRAGAWSNRHPQPELELYAVAASPLPSTLVAAN
jgi:hypothetical protein